MTTDILNIGDLDGRLRYVRRARALTRELIAAFGNPAPHQLILIRSAAELTAIAEQTRATLLAGGAVTLNDVVRAENAMARAIRALALPDSAKPAGLTLDEFLAAARTRGVRDAFHSGSHARAGSICPLVQGPDDMGRLVCFPLSAVRPSSGTGSV